MTVVGTLAAVGGLYLAAAASPGPNVLLIAQTAARRSRREALSVAGGVVVGGVVLASAAVLGLGLLLARFAWFDRSLRVACGAYLCYLAAKMWRHASEPLLLPQDGWRPESQRALFRRGLITNLSNPKAAVFFGTILTAALPLSAPLWVRAAAVAVIGVCSTAWHSFLAATFSLAPVQRSYARIKLALDRTVSVLLGILAVRLVAD